MPKSKSKSKSDEDPVEGEAALPVRKRAAGSKKSDEAPAKKPRGRPKGSRNKTTTTLIPDQGGAMELGIAAAHALSMPANAAGFAATLGMPSLPASITQGDDDLKPIDRGDMPKARETRLEQNRKAARESRRRKKVMIEELQRSVIFFSRANATLKTQNEEFQRLLIQAQTQIAQMEANGEVPKADGAVEVEADGAASAAEAGATGADGSAGSGAAPVDTQAAQQAVAAAQAAQQSFQFMQAQAAAQANAAAMQASFESQGYPPAAARVAAQTFSAAGGDGSAGASVSGQGGMVSMDPQALMQMQQAWMAQNPAFMQQFAMMAQQAGGGAAASAPAPAADNGSATV